MTNAQAFERALRPLDGVVDVTVNLVNGRAYVNTVNLRLKPLP